MHAIYIENSRTNEFSIRPLGTPEVRARRLGGRTQINESGQHLLDGVPFGRAYLRSPNRPRLEIPQRKRRLEEEVANQEELGSQLLLEDTQMQQASKRRKTSNSVRFVELTANENDEDEDEEDDEDFDPDNDSSTGSVSDEDEEKEQDFMPSTGGLLLNGPLRELTNAADDEEDEEDDFDFEPDAAGTRSKLTSEEDSDSDDDSSDADSSDDDSSDDSSSNSDSSDTSSDSSDSDAAPSEKTSKSTTAQDPASKGTSDQVPQTDGTGTNKSTTSKDLGFSPTQAANEQLQTELESADLPSVDYTPRHLVIPGQGKPTTKKRNERRKKKAQMEREAASKDSFTKDEAREETNAQSEDTNGVLIPQSTQQVIQKAKRLLQEAIELPNPRDVEERREAAISDFEERRKRLLESLGTGGIDVETSQDDSPSESPAKRVRLDVASTRRLLFGSLGVRTPKTKEEEQKLSDKLMTRYQRSPIPFKQGKSSSTAIEADKEEIAVEGATELGIKVSAVECVDKDVILSAPPYPFQQRWDPQYARDVEWPGDGQIRKPRRRKSRQSLVDYSENVIESITSAAVTPIEDISEDLPELPFKMDTLPDAKPSDIIAGAIIAYKEVECSEATNWAPIVSEYRTALVEQTSSPNDYEVVLARRDRRIADPKFDARGNRLLGRFEMPGEDQDEDRDDGYRAINYSELMVPKVVKPATIQGTVI